MTASRTILAERISEMQAAAATRLPAHVRSTFGADAARLDRDGVPAAAARPGSSMPDAALIDPHGQPVTLGAARAGRPAVVVFYRGAWCPYCNLALRAYQEHLLPALDERGIALIAISPQKPDGSLTMAEKNELGFAVLSDPGNALARALGIVMAPNEDVVAAQAELGLDVAAGNVDETAELPMPTVVLVDAAGTIRWIDIHPNYTSRTQPAEVLDALGTLG